MDRHAAWVNQVIIGIVAVIVGALAHAALAAKPEVRRGDLLDIAGDVKALAVEIRNIQKDLHRHIIARPIHQDQATKDIHARQLITEEWEKRIGKLETNLENMIVAVIAKEVPSQEVRERLADHETRLRELEQQRD